MRILQILHGREAGGVATLADAIGHGLATDGIEVEVAYLFERAGGTLGKIRGMLRVARLIVGRRYDAILAYQSSASILAAVIGWASRCPNRIVHQTALPREVKVPLRWLDLLVGSLGLYTVNVLNSRSTEAAFVRYPKRYRRDMVLIEHGVALPAMIHARETMLARYAVPDDGPILLNVGRLTAQKNQDVLIKALAALPEARLVVAGAGPLQADREALAEAHGVLDRLHLLGDVSAQDVADLLGSADVFVFPSMWETFGLAAVEAAMVGLPIVAADLPVLREVLAEAKAVRFAPPRDVGAWIDAIGAMIEVSRAGRDITRGAAVAERYAIDRMVAAYRAILGLGGAAQDRPSSPGPAARPLPQNH